MGSPKKHADKVAGQLQPGEDVLSTVAATITESTQRTSGTVRGALVLTNQRLMFSGTGWGSSGSRSTPLAQVTSVDLHKNLMTAHIQVTIAGGFQRYLVKYREAEPFVQAAHTALAAVSTQ